MSRIFLSKTEASRLRCSKCKGYLSVGPVTMSNDVLFCGRCPPQPLRATMYEELAKFMIFPCINEEYGCTSYLRWNAANTHEENCKFKPVECPIFGCTSEMAEEYVRRHLNHTHNNLISYLKKFTIPMNENISNADRIFFWKNTILIVKIFLSEENGALHFRIFSFNDPSNDLYYSFSVRSNNGEIFFDDSQFYKIFKYSKKEGYDTSKFELVGLQEPNNERLNCSSLVFAFNIKDNGPKSMASLNECIIAEIECPICLNYIRPPIYMCESSHNFCSSCFYNIADCPLCHSNLGNMRNLALEKISANLTYPCVNKIHDCEFREKLPKLTPHEAFCIAGGTRLTLIREKSENSDTVVEVEETCTNNILTIGQPTTLSISHLNKLHLLTTYDNEIFKISLNYKRGRGLQVVGKKISNISETCYTFYINIVRGTNTLNMSKSCYETNISDEKFTDCLIISDSFIQTVMVSNNITFVLFILQTN